MRESGESERDGATLREKERHSEREGETDGERMTKKTQECV